MSHREEANTLTTGMTPMTGDERRKLMDRIDIAQSLLALADKAERFTGHEVWMERTAMAILIEIAKEIEEQCTEVPF